jgi:hypothetical protein
MWFPYLDTPARMFVSWWASNILLCLSYEFEQIMNYETSSINSFLTTNYRQQSHLKTVIRTGWFSGTDSHFEGTCFESWLDHQLS